MSTIPTSRRSIDQFKAALAGGGVRPTMFLVLITFPNTLGRDPEGDSRRERRAPQRNLAEQAEFLIKASQIPASTIGQIEVPFRGRKLKVSGDRSFAEWTTTVTSDNSYTLRKTFEKWSEIIQNHNFALGANTLDEYYGTAIVRQLDRDGNQIRAYQMQQCWPTEVAAMDLDMDATDTVQDFSVTWAYNFWSAANADTVPAAGTPNEGIGNINVVDS